MAPAVITNDPTGNYVVAADINADGSLVSFMHFRYRISVFIESSRPWPRLWPLAASVSMET